MLHLYVDLLSCFIILFSVVSKHTYRTQDSDLQIYLFLPKTEPHFHIPSLKATYFHRLRDVVQHATHVVYNMLHMLYSLQNLYFS